MGRRRQQNRLLGKPQRLKRRDHILRFRSGHRQVVQNRHLIVQELAQHRHLRGDLERLLVQSIAPVNRLQVMGMSPTSTNRRPLRTHTGSSGPLLLVKLLLRTSDVATPLRLDRTQPSVRLVHDHRVMQQLLVHAHSQDHRVELIGRHLLPRLVEHRHTNHDPLRDNRTRAASLNHFKLAARHSIFRELDPPADCLAAELSLERPETYPFRARFCFQPRQLTHRRKLDGCLPEITSCPFWPSWPARPPHR